MRIRPRGLSAALTCLLLSAGCASSKDMSFKQDKRLHIVSPASGKRAHVPLTVSWTMRDFTAVAPGSPVTSGTGYYAIFLDKYPMAPGRSLASLSHGKCVSAEGCGTPAFLAQHLDVFVTADTSYTINAVPSTGTMGSSSHFLTIILVDGSGRRLGDASWTTSFSVAGAAS